MINIESITKGYGDNILFNSTSLQINHGEKVGFVGRNGHGKTTLLKMITGAEEPDIGKIKMPNDYRTGYLSQKLNFSKKSVLDECSLGLLKHEKDHYWKAEKILAGLGFSQQDMHAPPFEFSGGYQIRLNLAKVLVSESDLLILDEPTNYLDITSIRWLIAFLSSWPRELLLVTHDRSFMDNVVTHVAGVHRAKIRKVKGVTDKYYSKIIQDEEVYEKTRLNEERREKEIQTFITRFRAKARLANLVQSRVKALNKSNTRERLQKIESIDFLFNSVGFKGKQVLNAQDITFGYDNTKPLIKDFSIIIHPGDRIAIIGKNGKGKTTLLKLLAERLKLNSGILQYNPNVKMGYFEQTNINSLNDKFTIEQEIQNVYPELQRHQVRNICGAMMFDGDKALKKVAVLSGGEKSRTMIGKLLVTPLNLLMLDEPDNHLDMETSDSFLIALHNFEGAVVLITHNEMFLNTLANRLIVFNNNKVYIFEGSYSEFLDKEGWEEEQNSIEVTKKSIPDKVSKKEMRQKRSQIVAERSRVTKPIHLKIEREENLINELEENLKSLNNEIINATKEAHGKKIGDLSVRIVEIQEKIDVSYESLEGLFDGLEIKRAQFEEKLDQLERQNS
jgi:ATP-binding cassette subfamily F protein 3